LAEGLAEFVFDGIACGGFDGGTAGGGGGSDFAGGTAHGGSSFGIAERGFGIADCGFGIWDLWPTNCKEKATWQEEGCHSFCSVLYERLLCKMGA
jgi:hypothetical protein